VIWHYQEVVMPRHQIQYLFIDEIGPLLVTFHQEALRFGPFHQYEESIGRLGF
jgi:hypothetical protein